MALIDIYHALANESCYRKSMSYEDTFKIIKESMEQHFNPQLFIYFAVFGDKLESYYESQKM